MTATFSIKSADRLIEFQNFIKNNNLNSIRFLYDPKNLFFMNKYIVKIECHVDDYNFLSKTIFNEWHQIDNPKEESWFNKIINFLKN